MTAQPDATKTAAFCDGEQPRRRNAAQTREALLKVAKSRFARFGYATTTVREIADDAGVNVALINRYFTSKEGLFEACLATAVTEMSQEAAELDPEELAATIARRIAGKVDDARTHETLLLLIRSSGDERTDELRRAILRSLSTRLAAAAGGPDPDDARLLRAQLIISASLGMTLLRSQLGVEPMASASEQELSAAISEMLRALLPSPVTPPGGGA